MMLTSLQFKDRTLLYISVAVVIFHIIGIASTPFLSPQITETKSKKEQRLVVQTVTLSPPPKKAAEKAKKKPIQQETAAIVAQAEPEPFEQPVETKEVATAIIETIPEEPHRHLKPQKSIEKPKEKPIIKPKEQLEPTPKPINKKVQKTPADKKPQSKPIQKSTQKTSKPAAPVKKEVSKKTKNPPVKQSQPKKTTSEKGSPKKVDLKKNKVNAQEAAAQVKRRELIASAQKSIAKIGQSHDTLAEGSAVSFASTTLPGRIDNLQVETFREEAAEPLTSQEITYYDELASRLKLLLRLPEFGEVKIRLTLTRAGRFVKVSIVRAESNANRKYIEKTLPTVKYPSFGNNFSQMNEYTFVIALSNEL